MGTWELQMTQMALDFSRSRTFMWMGKKLVTNRKKGKIINMNSKAHYTYFASFLYPFPFIFNF